MKVASMEHLREIMDKRKELNEKLEALIDSNSLADILSSIASVCFEKEQHIAENWQDRKLANTWGKTGEKVNNLAAKLTV